MSWPRVKLYLRKIGENDDVIQSDDQAQTFSGALHGGATAAPASGSRQAAE